MLELSCETVENEIISTVKEICSTLKIVAEVDNNCIPAFIGFSSQALITVMGRLEQKLNIIIPNNCYIFIDKDNNKLSIEGAAKKLIKIAKKNGN